MKYKKIIILLAIISHVYLIYYFNRDTRITYLALGDSLSVGIDSNGNTNYGYSNYLANYLKEKDNLKYYSNAFASTTARIDDLLYSLEINQTLELDNKKISLKKCLREADLITLSIGMNNLLADLTLSTTSVDNFSNDEIAVISNNITKDLEQLFKELRKYCKNKIIFINYYNPYTTSSPSLDRLFSYLNTKTEQLTAKYNIDYVDIYTPFKNNPTYLSNPTNIYPTTTAYSFIANKIIEKHLSNN